MITVKNKKAIRNLADKSFRANRTRNLIAIIAIALTSVLFTTLFTMGMGTVESLQRAAMRQSGGDGHAVLKYITDEQFNNVKDHPLIKEISYNQALCDGVENEAFLKRHTEFWYFDDIGMKLGFSEPTNGHKPVAENEVIADTKTLQLLGVPLEVGAPITLVLNIRGEKVQRDFVLAGWWESDPVFNVGRIIASRAYVDAHLDELKNTYRQDYSMTGSINACIMFKNSLDLEGKLGKVITDSGYSMDPNSPDYLEHNVNWAYLSTNFGMDASTLIVLVSGLMLIIFTGYLIIYNIFQISVIRDIRFYGLMKTIGTTGKQIRHIIRRQALILSAFGVPFGLIAGYFTGKAFVPLIVRNSTYAGSAVSVSPRPVIFIGAALFSVVTVFISTFKPGRIAAAVSPLEAVRYTDGNIKQTKKQKKSVSGAKIHRMALANLGRNKKRTALVFISLSLSLVLLNTVFTLSQSIDLDKFLAQFVDTDFLIAHADYFLNNFRGPENQTSESLIQAVKNRPGFEEGGRLYGGRTEMITVEDEKNTEQKYNIDPNGDFIAAVYGLEELPLKRLELIDGELDFEKLSSGKYILEGVYLNDNNIPEIETTHFKVGETITLHSYKGMTEKHWESEYTTQEFTVLGHVAVKTFSNSDRIRWDYTFYLPADVYKTLVANPAVMSYAFNVSDDFEAEMEQFLQGYTDSVEPAMNYSSKFTILKEFSDMRDTVVMIGSVLSFVIGLIGILNFINTILTSIFSRRKEFAMLQSIGMTRKQLCSMLMLEGVYYALGTCMFSFVFGMIFSLLIVRPLENLLWFFRYRFILWPLLVVLPFLFVIGMIIPLLSYIMTDRQSIVERLREVE
ncbi:ABC transporter permease [Acetivibrio clariflavus]|uniref:ABC-type transport system, involved in lipoprotein release, permease component n=1 Tax=Acetivibrio clariflavus (strain DSM 19732 / NBRC 101661 / EBR45) TaxID=720554 RepID=G8LYM4_ACECE|nr:ABC transporter permease [Acetivibrio clariflavus]AEV70012.1 ABC-type transport system, involved in lipoprotein release, permease component [Acetivibrio clariflavus DSM 19732]